MLGPVEEQHMLDRQNKSPSDTSLYLVILKCPLDAGCSLFTVRRMRWRTGQQIGGVREFVVIDESHFRHKRKYGRGRMAGGWKRRKWVFGMLGKTSGKDKAYFTPCRKKITKTSCSCD
ncbi:uncharacterized protein si:dkeyp-13d11.2 [Melanotaenia boesemani]|uniref:uncharacterized protein si:dkeyp-13d11.2 n=1 Tax=Melanotaenia boesemani TaxID=1250792 RepID=UPI001C0483D4|nr:uncharacterized protein si:dkeyp-13d11.2 [Melanotaenia boesemani]